MVKQYTEKGSGAIAAPGVDLATTIVRWIVLNEMRDPYEYQQKENYESDDVPHGITSTRVYSPLSIELRSVLRDCNCQK